MTRTKAYSHVLEEGRAWLLMLIVLTIWFGNDWIGKVEGHFFPVTSQVSISPTGEVAPEGMYVYEGSAFKHRECRYDLDSLEWYLGSVSGPKVGVKSTFFDKPQVRPTGLLEWDGIGVRLDPIMIEKPSHAYVYHFCPWRPWRTRTLFYDSSRFTDKGEKS